MPLKISYIYNKQIQLNMQEKYSFLVIAAIWFQ